MGVHLPEYAEIPAEMLLSVCQCRQARVRAVSLAYRMYFGMQRRKQCGR